MLARFYGVYNVKIKYMKPISVVIMDNLMSEHVNEILRIYDLKGSLHKRITTKPKNNRSVRKDLNFLTDTDFLLRLTPL
jgi:Phosphatidylinositol-4-phosphate 5-Kinase